MIVSEQYRAILNESRADKNERLAKKYLERNLPDGYDFRQAFNNVRNLRAAKVPVSDDMPPQRSFILAVARFYCDDYIREDNPRDNSYKRELNDICEYLADVELPKWRRGVEEGRYTNEQVCNLFGMSMKDLENRYLALAHSHQIKREAVVDESSYPYNGYKIVPISSFEEAKKYNKYFTNSAWCITQTRNMFEHYIGPNGMWFFILKKGYQSLSERDFASSSNQFDEYGASMIAAAIYAPQSDVTKARLSSLTTRWNHSHGYDDNSNQSRHMAKDAAISQVSALVGFNIRDYLMKQFKAMHEDAYAMKTASDAEKRALRKQQTDADRLLFDEFARKFNAQGNEQGIVVNRLEWKNAEYGNRFIILTTTNTHKTTVFDKEKRKALYTKLLITSDDLLVSGNLAMYRTHTGNKTIVNLDTYKKLKDVVKFTTGEGNVSLPNGMIIVTFPDAISLIETTNLSPVLQNTPVEFFTTYGVVPSNKKDTAHLILLNGTTYFDVYAKLGEQPKIKDLGSNVVILNNYTCILGKEMYDLTNWKHVYTFDEEVTNAYCYSKKLVLVSYKENPSARDLFKYPSMEKVMDNVTSIGNLDYQKYGMLSIEHLVKLEEGSGVRFYKESALFDIDTMQQVTPVYSWRAGYYDDYCVFKKPNGLQFIIDLQNRKIIFDDISGYNFKEDFTTRSLTDGRRFKFILVFKGKAADLGQVYRLDNLKPISPPCNEFEILNNNELCLCKIGLYTSAQRECLTSTNDGTILCPWVKDIFVGKFDKNKYNLWGIPVETLEGERGVYSTYNEKFYKDTNE